MQSSIYVVKIMQSTSRLYMTFIVFTALKIHLTIYLLAGLYMQIIQNNRLKSELNTT